MKLSTRKRIESLAERHLKIAESFDANPRNIDAMDLARSAALLQSACDGFMLVQADKCMRLIKKMMKASGMSLDNSSNPFTDSHVGSVFEKSPLNPNEQLAGQPRAAAIVRCRGCDTALVGVLRLPLDESSKCPRCGSQALELLL